MVFLSISFFFSLELLRWFIMDIYDAILNFHLIDPPVHSPETYEETKVDIIFADS